MEEAAPYPRARQVVILALVVLPLMQLVLLPLLEMLPAHLSLSIAELFLLGIAVFVIRRRRWAMEDLFLLNATHGRGLLIVIPTAIAAGLLAGEADLHVARIWEWAGWASPLMLRRSMLEIQLITDMAHIVPTIVAIGLLPAICEETFFRGFVYTGLRFHHGPRVALIGSSMLFAVAHLNPWQMPAFFLLGLFLGWLVHRTHSIYPAILAHALNNLLSVLAVNLRAHLGIDPLGALEPVASPVRMACLVVLVLGILLLRRWPPLMPALSPFAFSRWTSRLGGTQEAQKKRPPPVGEGR